jgi:hypothetical protein
MVLDATNLLHATGGIDTSLGFLRIPAANSCTMSQGYLCLDVNGASSALTSPVLQSRSSSTDRFFPSFVSGDLGTAGTKRLMGIGTGNTTETTVATAAPAASSVPLADGSGKIADGWLPSGVLRLSGLDTEAEARASGIRFVPMSDTPAATGEVPIKGATAWEWHAPIVDLSGLNGRTVVNSYPVTPVLAYQNGDPNGHHACNAGAGDLNESSPSEVGRKLVYDKTGKQFWVCTGAGTTTTATWKRVAAEVQQESLRVASPTSRTYGWFRAHVATAARAIDCITDTGTVTLSVQECDATGSSCSGLDGGTALVCDSNGQSDDGALSNASIDAGDWVKITASATSGSPTDLALTLQYETAP